MADIIMEICLCLIVALFLMVFHESVKVLVYLLRKKRISSANISTRKISPWKFWRYIDPIGLILAVTCYVPVSKPYFFRIRDKRTNLILGITGLCSLLVVFVGSILVLRLHYGGIAGLLQLEADGFLEWILPVFWRYMAILSFGMLVANLFPVSTFDMGLLVAGNSSKSYLNIIKADGTIKVILILTLLLGIIRYGGVRLIVLLL